MGLSGFILLNIKGFFSLYDLGISQVDEIFGLSFVHGIDFDNGFGLHHNEDGNHGVLGVKS